MTFMQSSLAFLKTAEAAGKWDPPSLFAPVSKAVREMTIAYAPGVRQRGEGLNHAGVDLRLRRGARRHRA